jgi:UDP-hydrolysing UDP-N-acetyl-D-glucosamine 2-epimerase
VVGAPGLDDIDSMSYLNKEGLSQALQVNVSEKLFLITYHPVTLNIDGSESAINALIGALQEFNDATMVFAGVNSDPGNHVIRKQIECFVSRDPEQRVLVSSMKQNIYFSAVKLSKAIIGNSSSGLIEAPALGVPTINIGDRQKGRLRSQSVIDCEENKFKIVEAIKNALQPEFQKMSSLCKASYRSSNAASEIAKVLANTELNLIKVKVFQDIK